MLAQCWPKVADGGPTLGQRWVNVYLLVAGTAVAAVWAAVSHYEKQKTWENEMNRVAELGAERI